MAARLLYAAAALLAGVGVWLRVADRPLPAAEPAAVRVPAPPAAATPAPAPAPSAFQAVESLNVFAPLRTAPAKRFYPPGLEPAAPPPAPPPPARPAPPALVLYGITMAPDGARALIDADPAVPGAELYRVGAAVAGGRVVAIAEDSVIVDGPTGRRVLRLRARASDRPTP